MVIQNEGRIQAATIRNHRYSVIFFPSLADS